MERLGYLYSPEIFPMNNGELVGATNGVSQPSNSKCILDFSKWTVFGTLVMGLY